MLSPLDALESGWRSTRRHFWFLTATLLVAFIASALPALVRDALLDHHRPLGVAATVGAALFNVILLLGLVQVSLRIHDTDHAPLAALFDSADRVLSGLVTLVLLLLLMVLSVLPMVSVSLLTLFVSILSPAMVPVVLIGLSALAILALYSLSRYLFAVHLVVDQRLGPFRALRASGDVTRGVRGRVLGLTILVMALNAAGALMLGVGLLVTLPLSLLTVTAAYRQLVVTGSTSQPARQAPGGIELGSEQF
jgi:hypothetical protein